MVRLVRIAVYSVCTALSFSALAQQTPPAQVTQQAQQVSQMELLNDSMDNMLPIKGQRFRIDDNVKEITLLFFREPDSSPLIIIRPDGSKWYDSDYPVDRVTWYTDPNFDMIKIVEPEPGPWQVAGRVDEKNKALVVSEIKFEADALPKQLFVNEQIKVEGVLYNGDEPIKTSRFRETVTVDVLFVSSNNPDFDNFGANPSRVAEFSDDGQGYDESRGDGIFTGQFNLSVVPGEYIPTYQLQTPLYERSFEDDAVVVEPQPVTFNVVMAEERGADNFLEVSVDKELIQPSSVVVNGSIGYPNGEQRKFSVTQMGKFPYRIPLANLAYGKHLIELTVFATSQQGREFVVNPRTLSFISVEPVRQPTEEELAEQARMEAERKAEEIRLQKEAEEQEFMMNLIIVAVINVVIIIGAVVFVWLRRRKKSAPEQETD